MLHLETKNILSEKGLRVTDFRLQVLEVFKRHENAIDTELLENSLEEFDRITLYRTLKTFIETGIIHEIVMPGDTRKLALCKDDCHVHENGHEHQHLHFKCENCNQVFCLELKEFPVVKYPKFKIHHLEILGSGLCEGCR